MLEGKLAKNQLAGHPALETYEAAFAKRVGKVARLQEVETLIDQANFLVMRDDLRGMKRVLRRLDHIDKQGVVQLKGRMACEISSCDEILLTEIVFQNVFENMQPNHILALCSCPTSSPHLLPPAILQMFSWRRDSPFKGHNSAI